MGGGDACIDRTGGGGGGDGSGVNEVFCGMLSGTFWQNSFVVLSYND